MTYTGRCACGAIEFEVTGQFIGFGSCHCHSCQKFSGGGPNYVALAPRDALHVTKGEAQHFTSKGDSGATVHRVFCGKCGTPLWSIPQHEPFLPVKLGALNSLEDIDIQMQIYTKSAPKWHPLSPDIPNFPTMPPNNK